ncbi:MAG TPA: phosphotransferase [Solirubrobacterales bacterium]|nr:phosphotransferase [Solirubrobacterales bacterium]
MDLTARRAIFGDDAAGPMRSAVAELVGAELGTSVAGWLFTIERRSVTFALALADGRGVVVKAHPPGSVDAARLAAVQTVQRHLADSGFACPRPLVEPVRLGRGIAVVESLLDDGRSPDPDSVEDLRAMARVLAAITTACEALRPLRQLHVDGVPGLPAGALWPPPPDPRLVLGAGPEAAWIDGIGARARRFRTRPASAPLVIGHGDWHVEHLRLNGGDAAAVYDWDSLLEAPEPFLVGCAVGGFTADWSVDEPPVVPDREVATRFVADYEEARGRRFSPAERATTDAHWLEMTAYAARIELAREEAGLAATRSYRGELAEHAECLDLGL